MFDFFKNFRINLTANGRAAVVIVWIIAFTALALYGQESVRVGWAQGAMIVIGVMLVRALGEKP